MLIKRTDGKAAKQRLASAYQGLSAGGLDRRAFLRQAGLGGAGLAEPRSTSASGMGQPAGRRVMGRRRLGFLRLGVVGMARRGRLVSMGV